MNRTMGKSMVFIDRNFQVTINLSEKVWKSLEKSGKVWKSLEKSGKVWKSMFKSGADLKKWAVGPLDSLKLGMVGDRGLDFF